MTQVSAPQPGAIVFARFPEAGSAAKSKMRPALVINTETRNGVCYLTVVKGTSQHTDELYQGEFAVRAKEDMLPCGLTKPTKFQLSRIEQIPFTVDWCSTKVAGNLPTHLQRALLHAARQLKLL